MKRLISAAFFLAALLCLACVPAGAFSDVKDAELAREIAVLQTMGVVDGLSPETFAPDGTLTRAQFCKMAILLKGDGAQEPLYRNRTIFPDVRSDHWARGYINLAVSTTLGADSEGKGGTRLIRGTGDGRFEPDRPITFAEAVTILIRMLGYSDADAGMSWPQGYLSLAEKNGLTDGLSLGAKDALTRAQAVRLFYQMLATAQSSGEAYYNTLGTATAGVVLMDANAIADDGTSGALRTSEGTFKLASGVVSPNDLTGFRGVLITDKSGKVKAFLPRGARETAVVRSAENGSSDVEAGWLTDQSGVRHEIPQATAVYTAEEKKTWKDVWMDLRAGTPATLFYNDSGKIDCLYLATAATDRIAVAYEKGAADVRSLVAGAGEYKVYRDGLPSSIYEVCQYDVASFDPAARVLSVSSAKLTGLYENASPNPRSPDKITTLGIELEVMGMAANDLTEFKLGEAVTFLLAPDGRVAGAVSPKTVREENIGILESGGDSVKVKLFSGHEASGKTEYCNAEAGDLVYVGSSKAGRLSATRVTAGQVSGTLDLSEDRFGTAPLSLSCRFFDEAGGDNVAREVRREEITAERVPSSQILYAHKNTGGSIDLVIFNNLTNNAYVFGRIGGWIVETGSGDDETDDGYVDHYNVENSQYPNGTGDFQGIYGLKRGEYVGVAFSSDGKGIRDFVRLTAKTGVRRADFTNADGKDYVNLGSRTVLVSSGVHCYNAQTDTWFKSLEECRAFSDNLTCYYDKTPEQGGQVRVIVAN